MRRAAGPRFSFSSYRRMSENRGFTTTVTAGIFEQHARRVIRRNDDARVQTVRLRSAVPFISIIRVFFSAPRSAPPRSGIGLSYVSSTRRATTTRARPTAIAMFFIVCVCRIVSITRRRRQLARYSCTRARYIGTCRSTGPPGDVKSRV